MSIKVKKDWEIALDIIESAIKDDVSSISYVHKIGGDPEVVSDVSDREVEIRYKAKMEVYDQISHLVKVAKEIMKNKERW